MISFKVFYSIEMLGYFVFKYEERPDGRYVINKAGKATKVKYNSAIKMEDQCYLFLRDDEAQILVEALTKANVKAPNDFKLEGVLEATKDHLADMRKLVFKDKA